MKSSIHSTIPVGWRKIRLKGLLSSRVAGAWGANQGEVEQNSICMRVADFDFPRGVFAVAPLEDLTVRSYTRKQIEYLQLQKGDILVEKSGGGDKTPLGRAVMFDKDYIAVFSNFMERLRICAYRVNAKFFYYSWVDKYWTLELYPFVKQTTGIQNLSMAKLVNEVRIRLPAYVEQERIVAFLDEKCATVDKAIEVKRKQLESVEPQWANLLHNVTLRGIRPSRLQKTTNVIIEKIPIGWKLKRLRYIGRCQNGISKDGQYFGYGFPFVTYGDVYNNMALPVVASGLVESTEDERIRYSVKRGDVFFTRTSETADEVGFSSVCLKTIPDATFAGFVIRVRPVTEDLLPEFAQYYFRNPFVSQYFAKEMMVVTRASLSQDILKSLPVLIPPRDEQAQIAQYLGERRSYFDSLSANLRKQIETLEQYRKSLIHEYVTGVRRVV